MSSKLRGERVLILGGGIGGLSVAHELAERGFVVTLCEARPGLGGKARSYVATDAGLDGCALPAEHGFRFFPGFYRHVTDTMARIPTGPGRTVRDHLTAASVTTAFTMSGGSWTMPNRPFGKLGDLRSEASFIYQMLAGSGGGIPAEDVRFYVDRQLTVLGSCDARRMEEYERTSFWDFMQARRRSQAYQRYLVAGMTKTLVACNARKISARTGGVVGGVLLLSALQEGGAHLLDGPTNDVWIDPWRQHLEHLGVAFRFGARVTRLGVRDRRVSSVAIEVGGKREELTADHYVLALPADAVLPLLDADVLEAAPALASLRALQTDWMVGVQFYLDRDLPLNHGHSIYFDSPWALTAVSQTQFWPRYHHDDHGGVRTILSVDVSDWDTPGLLFDKPARRSTREEIRQEVWTQLRAHWPHEIRASISASNIRGWSLGSSIAFGPDGMTNEEPLLINTAGSWQHRPEATTDLDNLFLAADYVRTNTDLATMEGANEAARRAANAILLRSRHDGTPCSVFPLSEPGWLEPLKAIDKLRWEQGLPPQPLYIDELGRGLDALVSRGIDALRRGSRWLGEELLKRGHDKTIATLDWRVRSVIDTVQEVLGKPLVPDAPAATPAAGTNGPLAGPAETSASRFARRIIATAVAGGDPEVARLAQDLLEGVAACERKVAESSSPELGPIVGGAIHQMLLTRGKHMRALCVLLCASVARRRFPAEAIELAAAVELVQSATLMHDDVIDESDVRRGLPAARVVYGNPASILGGNVLMLKASALLVEVGRPDLFLSLRRTMDEIVAGEGRQLANRGNLLLDEAAYFDVIRAKTAVLFRWACRAGAVGAGRPSEEVEVLARFGEALGIAFQVADDILDVAGDPSVTGKALFGDLRERKATYPLIVAARQSEEVRDTLERLIAGEGELEPEEIQQTLIRIVTAPEALAAARRGAREIAAHTRAILDQVTPGPALAFLRALADEAALRDR